MKTKKLAITLIAVILTVIAIAYFLSFNQETYTYKVSYFPFYIHTYGAVDEEHIDERACFIFEMSSKKIDRLYRNVLKSYKKSHEYKDVLNIRVKLTRANDGKIIYITQVKEVVYESHQYDIDMKTIKAVVKDIYEYSQKMKNRFEEEDPYMCEQPDEFDEKLFGF